MKNISRRVFIKGLAVAGVAAAASTVLAGCNTNMIPDVDNGTDDKPVEDVTNGNVQTVTFVDQVDSKKKLTMDITNVVTEPVAGNVILSVKITNNLGDSVWLANASVAASTGKKYVIYPTVDSVLSANNTDVKNSAAVDATSAPSGVDNLFPAAAKPLKLGDGNTAVGVLVLSGMDQKWAKAALSLKVNKLDGANAITGYDVVKFNLTNK